MQLIRDIGERLALPENRPDWIHPDVPHGVQADQFLHIYYHTIVRPHSEKDAYLAHFDRNKGDPEGALQWALRWWKAGAYPHANEDHTIYTAAPLLRRYFSQGSIDRLNRDEWVDAFSNVHAFRDHASKMENAQIGLGLEPGSMTKTKALAAMLWDERSKNGSRSAREVLDYVVWGPGDVAKRIWTAKDDDHKIRHLGPNIYGEIVGWARPSKYPPRNTRTNKALTALGNNIRIALT